MSSWEEHAKQTERFLWHFTEMAVILLIGMFLLNIASSFVPPESYPYISRNNPASFSAAMLLVTTALIASWLRYRHYSPSRIGEMILAMTLPAIVLIVTSAMGFLSGSALVFGSDVLIWAGALCAMLYHWAEYSRLITPLPRLGTHTLGTDGPMARPLARASAASLASVQVQKEEDSP